jgi:hypothetical protein
MSPSAFETPRTCPICKTEFLPSPGGRPASYCSNRCKWTAKRRRRRAARATEALAPVADGCWVCGRPAEGAGRVRLCAVHRRASAAGGVS